MNTSINVLTYMENEIMRIYLPNLNWNLRLSLTTAATVTADFFIFVKKKERLEIVHVFVKSFP